ncbi:MAG: hypothetical protein LBS11_04505 [Oscillospiraceae bacterium]|jgi:phage shock protein PspC (stress-responsive transcriptional regulator)|nr:hypothetical protein [Oscillospiraceae bacterium]
MKENILKILSQALLVILGALAHQLQIKAGTSVRLIQFVSGCFIVAFTGTMVYFLAESMELDSNIAYVTAGIRGWVEPQILDTIAEIFKKFTGLQKRVNTLLLISRPFV